MLSWRKLVTQAGKVAGQALESAAASVLSAASSSPQCLVEANKPTTCPSQPAEEELEVGAIDLGDGTYLLDTGEMVSTKPVTYQLGAQLLTRQINMQHAYFAAANPNTLFSCSSSSSCSSLDSNEGSNELTKSQMVHRIQELKLELEQLKEDKLLQASEGIRVR